MKLNLIKEFGEAHQKSFLQNKTINYEQFIEKILLMVCDPRFKELEKASYFYGFFNEKYKTNQQKATQFQAAIDFLLSGDQITIN